MEFKMVCCLCLFTEKHARPAVTIINGQAVCEDHSGYVQGGQFTQSLIVVNRENNERKNGTQSPTS